MALLNVKTIEQRVSDIAEQEEFSDELLFDLLLAYGRSKGNNTRLRNGSINVAADPDNEYAQKNVVYFRSIASDEPLNREERETRLLNAVEELRTHERAVRYTTRFVIVTDFHWLAAIDTKTTENRIFPIRDLAKHYAFFLPWAGMEKAQYIAEKPADTKAAERMGQLFDALLQANAVSLETDEDRHGLNIFFTRLLFCYFAEDTDLFPEGAFTQAIASHSREDGSDTAEVITDIFAALDIEDKTDLPAHLQIFPYVNGRLFSANAAFQVPNFNRKSRTLLIELGRMIWQDINPDIFGSMFQAVVQSGSRSELGQHYTSVPNILKTIEPLFLNDLKEEFEKSYDSVKKLTALLERLSAIKIFDPACGSGNFLVIAYKELRRLEHAILDRLSQLSVKHQTLFTDSVIKVDRFYGIEIDDFASEVAILALWIAKHQMNMEYFDKFGVEPPMIPLRRMGQITCANATRVDWEEVCPHDADDEVYLIGNPPYLGSSMQSKEQKEDLAVAYNERKYSKSQDYVSAWFIKGADYIAGTRAQLAFVTTNSVSQGSHVAQLFPSIFELGVEIGYAYTSFKWENSAKGNAGVTVAVISLRRASNKAKFIYTEAMRSQVEQINGYLMNGTLEPVRPRRVPLSSGISRMAKGSQPTDGGHLNFNTSERDELLDHSPEAKEFIKHYMGSAEFIRGEERFCLWINEDEVTRARGILEISTRLEKVAAMRATSSKGATQELSLTPWRFAEQRYRPTESIIVPSVSSERREYVPIGFLGKDTVVSNLAFAVYDAEPWLFALLTSKIHTAWLEAVGGKMETRYRYSSTLVYNTFPIPHLTAPMKEKLNQTAFRILDVREYFCEYTLEELYDSGNMPEMLRQAHAENDALVDSIYRRSGFDSDEERLAALFTLYEKMIAEEEAAEAEARAAKKSKKKSKTTAKK